jgi:hypothetical protein
LTYGWSAISSRMRMTGRSAAAGTWSRAPLPAPRNRAEGRADRHRPGSGVLPALAASTRCGQPVPCQVWSRPRASSAGGGRLGSTVSVRSSTADARTSCASAARLTSASSMSTPPIGPARRRSRRCSGTGATRSASRQALRPCATDVPPTQPSGGPNGRPVAALRQTAWCPRRGGGPTPRGTSPAYGRSAGPAA